MYIVNIKDSGSCVFLFFFFLKDVLPLSYPLESQDNNLSCYRYAVRSSYELRQKA